MVELKDVFKIVLQDTENAVPAECHTIVLLLVKFADRQEILVIQFKILKKIE